MSNQSRIFNYQIAAVLFPAVAVGLFQVVLNKPAQATASNSSVEFLELPVVPQWSVLDDPKATEPMNINSPLWYESPEEHFPVFPLNDPSPINITKEPDPIFTLTAVLPSANNSLAVIDGKPRSEGDQVAEDWTLHKIIGSERCVVLIHSSGRRVRVQMSQN